MKQVLLLFFLITSFCKFEAQNSNLSIQTGSMSAQSVVCINRSTFLLYASYFAPGCCVYEGHLQGRDAANNQIFDIALTYEQGTSEGKLYQCANNTILLFQGTRMKSCDSGGPRFKVAKYDTLGNAVFTFTTNERITQLLPKPNGGFYTQVGDVLRSYSSNGSALSTFSMNTGGIVNCATLLANGQVFVNYTWNSFVRYRILDTLGNIQSDVVMNPACTMVREGANGFLYSLNNGGISKYTSTLSLVASTSTTALNGNTILNFDLQQDTLYAILTNSLGNSAYAVFDNQLNLVFQSALNPYPTYLKEIKYSKIDHKTRIIGTGIYGGGTVHGSANLFTLNKFGQFSAQRDVGVVSVQASIITVYSYSYFPTPVMFYEPAYLANTVVKNFGLDTIKYFRLNYFGYRGGIFPCLLGFSSGYTLSIAPGGTISVQTPPFSSSPVRQDQLAADGSFTIPICIFATTPDNYVDQVFANNGACVDVRVETVGISEIKEERDFVIAPNPVESLLLVSAKKSMTKLSLFDALGRVVLATEPEQQSYELDCTNYPPGIYLIEVQIGNEKSIKKLIMQ